MTILVLFCLFTIINSSVHIEFLRKVVLTHLVHQTAHSAKFITPQPKIYSTISTIETCHLKMLV